MNIKQKGFLNLAISISLIIIAFSVGYYLISYIPKNNLLKAKERASKECYQEAEELGRDPWMQEAYSLIASELAKTKSLEEGLEIIQDFHNKMQEDCVKRKLTEWGY